MMDREASLSASVSVLQEGLAKSKTLLSEEIVTKTLFWRVWSHMFREADFHTFKVSAKSELGNVAFQIVQISWLN